MTKTTGDDVARATANAGAPTSQERGGKAVSLLARVILPRPGEPLDVRKLYLEESTTNSRRAHASNRTSLQIGAESEVSFATYFNAFPASYWRRWTTCTSVVLRAELTGTGRVDVYRTKATGARIFVEGREFASTGDQPVTVEFRRVLFRSELHRHRLVPGAGEFASFDEDPSAGRFGPVRSEERRVGKECLE